MSLGPRAGVWGLAALVAVTAFAPVRPPSSPQDARPGTPAAADTVVVGVLRDWPPEYLTSRDGEPSGFARDVMDAVAQRAGLAVRYRVFPDFAAVHAALRQGVIDVIPNIGIADYRRDFMAFTRPVETFAIGLFVRASNGRIHSVADLNGHPVGVVELNLGVELARDWPGARSVVYTDERNALFGLLSGEIDALVYPAPAVRRLARSAGVEGSIKEVGGPIVEVPRAMAILAGRPDDLLARLDSAIEAFVPTPAYRELYARWHAPPRPFWTGRNILIAAVIVLVAVILAMALWRHLSVVRLNRRLGEQEARYRFLVESLSEGVVITDADGVITFANHAAVALLGYSAGELVGLPETRLMVDDEATAGARLARRLTGIAEAYETRLRRRDGQEVWVEVRAAPYRQGPRIAGTLAAIVDVTERRRVEAELRQRDERIHQQQRLEAIGRLAAGIAHDFNNLLTAIGGYASLLAEQRRPGEGEEVDQIVKATARAADLTRQLLAFSRQQVSEPRNVALGEVILDLEPLIRRLIGEDVVVSVQIADAVAPVRADPAQLEQVVMNLVVNARDAMPQGGMLRVTLRNGEPGSVELRVADTGAGMDEATIERIFEPFFTTKEVGQGTGLGLSTVYGIVRQAGGSVKVSSRPGQGAAFLVTLPAAPDEDGDGAAGAEEGGAVEGAVAAEAAAGGEPARKLSGRGEHILVAEDEAGVRRLVERILEGQGYVVRCASSGDHALALLKADDGPLDLLITDVVMPGIRGTELARQLRARRPELPILFMSGYSERAELDPGHLDDPRSDYLPKPFTPGELRERVRALLDAAVLGVSASRSRASSRTSGSG